MNTNKNIEIQRVASITVNERQLSEDYRSFSRGAKFELHAHVTCGLDKIRQPAVQLRAKFYCLIYA